MTTRSNKPATLTKEVFEVHLEYLRKDLTEIRTGIIRLNDRVDAQDKTLLRNTITVEEHQRRSTMLEESQSEIIDTLKSISDAVGAVKAQANGIEEELIPIKNHTQQVNKFLRLLIVIDENKALIGKIIMFTTIIIISLWAGISKAPLIESTVKAMLK